MTLTWKFRKLRWKFNQTRSRVLRNLPWKCVWSCPICFNNIFKTPKFILSRCKCFRNLSNFYKVWAQLCRSLKRRSRGSPLLSSTSPLLSRRLRLRKTPLWPLRRCSIWPPAFGTWIGSSWWAFYKSWSPSKTRIKRTSSSNLMLARFL